MSHFDQMASSAAGTQDPPWRAAARAAAFTAFTDGSMPTQEEEIWRYVDLDISMDDYDVAAGSVPDPGPSSLTGAVEGAAAVRVVNGEFDGADLHRDGLHVTSLRNAVVDRSDDLREVFERVVPAPTEHLFAAASMAFGGGGVLVHAERNVTRPPVTIDVVSAGPGTASFPSVVLIADRHAELSVVVHLRSAPGDGLLVVPQISVIARDGAHVALTLVQDLDYSARSIGSLRAAIGADGEFRFGEVGLGGRLARLHLDVGLEGRGSTANIVGAYFGEQHQILDYRYFMRHIGTHTRSDMFLKGAVEDEARSVFTGMIRIEESGQKTEAYQTNRNLILSEGASAQSVPNLEILANDVRCGHGSTVGPLDAGQRYYLMSRGLDPQAADRLQMRGFFEEALVMLPHPELAGTVRDSINRKYETAQAEGRV